MGLLLGLWSGGRRIGLGIGGLSWGRVGGLGRNSCYVLDSRFGRICGGGLDGWGWLGGWGLLWACAGLRLKSCCLMNGQRTFGVGVCVWVVNFKKFLVGGWVGLNFERVEGFGVRISIIYSFMFGGFKCYILRFCFMSVSIWLFY